MSLRESKWLVQSKTEYLSNKWMYDKKKKRMNGKTVQVTLQYMEEQSLEPWDVETLALKLSCSIRGIWALAGGVGRGEVEAVWKEMMTDGIPAANKNREAGELAWIWEEAQRLPEGKDWGLS